MSKEGVTVTPEQQSAYVLAQSVSALVEAIGMLSANMAHYYRPKEAENTLMPYFRPDKFIELIDKYGISHNAVIALFQQ